MATPNSPSTSRPTTSSPIIFYDGQCGLCDHFVQFVLQHDRDRVFRFAPLQGETFAEWSKAATTSADLRNTVILVDIDGHHTRSNAALRVLRQLEPPWSAFGRLAGLVPRPLRDLGYRLVARWRHRLFRPPEICRRPDPADQARFLP